MSEKYEKMGVKPEQARILKQLEVDLVEYIKPTLIKILKEGIKSAISNSMDTTSLIRRIEEVENITYDNNQGYFWGFSLKVDEINQEVIELSFCTYQDRSCWIDFKEFPETIGQLTSLQKLTLEGKEGIGLSFLPKSIGNLKHLTFLNLEENELKELPDTIGGLTSLETLILGCNELWDLPESIGRLPRLKLLDLGENNFQSIPKSLNGLKTLEKLEMEYNNIKSTRGIENLKNLKSLKLVGNPIRNVDGLEQLDKLEYLDVYLLVDRFNPYNEEEDLKLKKITEKVLERQFSDK